MTTAKPFWLSIARLRPTSTNRKLRKAGDVARDNGEWLEAAEHYQAYLLAVPDDAAIWVQRGHVLKEAGEYAGAEEAYARALELKPDDDDVRLHLAHMLKKLERPGDAASQFGELYGLVPTVGTLTELKRLGQGYQSFARTKRLDHLPQAGSIFIEIKDLLDYLSTHKTVTGITRVTLGLVNYVLQGMGADDAGKFHFVQKFADGEGLLLIEKSDLREIVRAATSSKPDMEAIRTSIDEMRSSSMVFELGRGDTYLIVGAFWEFVDNPSWLLGMRHRGVHVGAYIYDLIPITHARFCPEGLTTTFSSAFADTSRLLSFCLTISEFVATEVRQYLVDARATPLPVIAVPLAHELRFQDDHGVAIKTAPSQTGRRRFLAGFPFVLCVCTIEARKNHAYMFDIWRRLIENGISVPDLVFVGRPGWHVDALMRDIADTQNLDGHLHILHGLSDDELDDLYDRCLFTMFPSYVEGWGLPVGESLAHGKLCIASSTSSIPEVGGDFTIYVDPLDVDGGYATVESLILNPSLIAEREQLIRDRFVARTWNDVGRDFFTAVGQLTSTLAQERPFAPKLAPATFIDTSKLPRSGESGSYPLNPLRLAFAEGWRRVEAPGTWMLTSRACLQVQTDCPPLSDVSVLLHVGTSPWVDVDNLLLITAGAPEAPSGEYKRPARPSSDFWVNVVGKVDAQSRLSVNIEIGGPVTTPPGDFEPVTLKLYAWGYGVHDDPNTRIRLLENALARSQRR